MKKLIIPLVLLALIFGFSSDASAGAACYAVSGEIDFVKVGPVISGTFSGDLEGTMVVQTTFVGKHGVARFRDLTQTWVVADSIVEPLIGRTLRFEGFLKGQINHWPILKTTHKLTLVEGAELGNLTAHGWTDVTDYPYGFVHHSEYHGVICP
ncbi:MAG: hypothetical protein ABFS03_09875 [Chloroflexota bacterium]